MKSWEWSPHVGISGLVRRGREHTFFSVSCRHKEKVGACRLGRGLAPRLKHASARILDFLAAAAMRKKGALTETHRSGVRAVQIHTTFSEVIWMASLLYSRHGCQFTGASLSGSVVTDQERWGSLGLPHPSSFHSWVPDERLSASLSVNMKDSGSCLSMFALASLQKLRRQRQKPWDEAAPIPLPVQSGILDFTNNSLGTISLSYLVAFYHYYMVRNWR